MSGPKKDNRAVLAAIAMGLAAATLSTFAVVLPFHGLLGWLP